MLSGKPHFDSPEHNQQREDKRLRVLAVGYRVTNFAIFFSVAYLLILIIYPLHEGVAFEAGGFNRNHLYYQILEPVLTIYLIVIDSVALLMIPFMLRAMGFPWISILLMCSLILFPPIARSHRR
jgi:hypothetical protein